MRTNELRLGNLIKKSNDPIWIEKFKGEITIVDISILEIIDSENKKNKIRERIDFYEPISLTEEWLIKFGFKKFSDKWNNNTFRNKYLIIKQHKDHFTYLSGLGKLVKIKYIHKIQNLYFALTGNELEIKL